MPSDLEAHLIRTYVLQGKRVLLLREGCKGGVEPGDEVEIETTSGAMRRATVKSVAWGSGFHAEAPPLTLIVDGAEDVEVAEGAKVVGCPTATMLPPA